MTKRYVCLSREELKGLSGRDTREILDTAPACPHCGRASREAGLEVHEVTCPEVFYAD